MYHIISFAFQFDVEETLPVKMTCAHPQVEKNGTIWNIGTNYDPKKGYSYSVIKYEKTNPTWSGKHRRRIIEYPSAARLTDWHGLREKIRADHFP